MSRDSQHSAPAGAATPLPAGTPFVELDDAPARHLASLIGMTQDLEFAAHLLERLETLLGRESADPVTVKCLWTTALVHYARAFEAGGRAGARAGDIYQGLKGDPIGAHRDILRLSEEQRLPVDNPLDRVRVGVVLEGPDAGRAVSGTGVIAVQRGIASTEAVRQLAALVAAARRGVAGIGVGVQNEILDAARTQPLDALYARARRVGADGTLAP
jgi:hypothetical protein